MTKFDELDMVTIIGYGGWVPVPAEEGYYQPSIIVGRNAEGKMVVTEYCCGGVAGTCGCFSHEYEDTSTVEEIWENHWLAQIESKPERCGN